VRGWLREFGGTGLASVDPAAYPEREGRLTRAREASPVAALRETPPRDTNGVRDIILRRLAEIRAGAGCGSARSAGGGRGKRRAVVQAARSVRVRSPRPARRPSTEISSSSSCQWMPRRLSS